MNTFLRTHVILPRHVVEAVDRVVGQRRRSAFVVEALQEKLVREIQARALQDCAGTVDASRYPAWETTERISAWVHASRARDGGPARTPAP